MIRCIVLFTGLLIASSQPALAQPRATIMDDSDLSGPPVVDAESLLQGESVGAPGQRIFKAQQIPGGKIPWLMDVSVPNVYGTFHLSDAQGRDFPGRRVKMLLVGTQGVLSEAITDENGNFSIPIPARTKGKVSLRLRLENPAWSIQNSATGIPYEWELTILDIPASGGVHAGSFCLNPAAANAKMGYIHLQMLEAMDFFVREGVEMSWWRRLLIVAYPSRAAYFNPWDFALHLVKPEEWDVNLHEFGHAVMAAGTDSYGGGGEHYIDRCYDGGLAWSEGWASFFAGAAHLSRDDEDARFQYMVPRRAPVRIENVPGDVCKGDTNEWQVTAGLWDLYDTHMDGRDQVAIPFIRIWSAIRGQSMGSFSDAWRFIRKGLNAQELTDAVAALQQNTLLPNAPMIGSGKPRQRVWPPIFSMPDWDGFRTR